MLLKISLQYFRIKTACKNVFLTFFILIPFQIAFGQGGMKQPDTETDIENEPIRELKVGDVLPRIPLQRAINYPGSYLDLEKFHGSLLVLDFWNTYCSVCIEQFPKYEKLIKEYSGKVYVIPVTTAKEDVIQIFWNKNRITKSSTLPSIVNDHLLSSYFKHSSMPHLVWINGEGKVIAITNHEYFTKQRIEEALLDKTQGWSKKEDVFNFNYDRPLVNLNANVKGLAEAGYCTLLNAISGVNPRWDYRTIDSIKNTINRTWVNVSISSLYLAAIGQTNENYWIRESSIIWNVKDSSRFFYNISQPYYDWAKKNTYCFEMKYGINTNKVMVSNMMLANLNTFLNLSGRVEKRKVEILAIVKANPPSTNHENINTKGILPRKKYNYASVDALTKKLSGSIDHLPVFNESGVAGSFNIYLDDNKNIKKIREDLRTVGLDIVKVKKDIEMLVIEEL